MSFPEPLISCHIILFTGDESLSSWPIWGNTRKRTRPDIVASLVPLLEPVYKLPQGEMLHALCDSLVPCFGTGHPVGQTWISELFSELLTRNGVSVRHFLALLR